MKCLILAAGYATRLYPLTENFPKPLLEVGGKTILDWLVDDIDGAGLVDGFIIISNHKFAGHFRQWAEGKSQAIEVVDDGTSTNETRLGAVCDIQYAIDKLQLDEDLVVIAGDNVLDFSLQRFVRYVAQKRTSCVMRYFEPSEERLRKCGVLQLDGDLVGDLNGNPNGDLGGILDGDLVTGMEEKPSDPKSHWCCPPFYFYTREDAARIPRAIAEGCGTDAPGSFIAWLCAKTKVHAMEMPGRRYDIGNLESYRAVQNEYRGIQH